MRPEVRIPRPEEFPQISVGAEVTRLDCLRNQRLLTSSPAALKGLPSARNAATRSVRRKPAVSGFGLGISRRAGFTLIELLVVLAIIGILAGLLLPTLGRAKATAKGIACLSNLHQVGIALQLYVGDNNNRMPTMYDRTNSTLFAGPSPDMVLSNQLANANVLRCPADQWQVFETSGSSYSWMSALNGQSASSLNLYGIEQETRIPLMFDKEKAFHSARGAGREINFLYADWHLRNLFETAGSP